MKKIILVMVMFLLVGCGGTSSSTPASGSASATVNCASGSVCPPSQINVISPKTN